MVARYLPSCWKHLDNLSVSVMLPCHIIFYVTLPTGLHIWSFMSPFPVVMGGIWSNSIFYNFWSNTKYFWISNNKTDLKQRLCCWPDVWCIIKRTRNVPAVLHGKLSQGSSGHIKLDSGRVINSFLFIFPVICLVICLACPLGEPDITS